MFQPPYKNILSSVRTDIFSSPVSTGITQPKLHIFFTAQQPTVRQGLRIVQASRSSQTHNIP